MDTLFALAILVSIVALALVMKGWDVRLVLLGAALILASVAGNPLLVFEAFYQRMGDGAVIGPICSAMGFSFVLRYTGCDREMVRMLMRPLLRFRWLFIPGGCAVGFICNMAITSQTATAAAVGPILIPLMTAAGYHPLVAAATLVMGCSAGGNLLNPGEADITYIQTNTGAPVHQIISTIAIPELAAFAVAVLVMTLLLKRNAMTGSLSSDTNVLSDNEPVDWLRAVLPPLPIIILFVLMPSFQLVPFIAARYPDGLPVSHAMIASTIVLMLVLRKDLSAITKQFFEGLGYGYVQVISLIISASCFIESLKLCGVLDTLVRSVSSTGILSSISAALSTLVLAVISGSGTAPSISFSKAVLGELLHQGMAMDAVVRLGSLAAIGATFGRTMSPVAAIVLFASTLTNVPAKLIVKQTAIPLLIALCLAIVLLMN